MLVDGSDAGALFPDAELLLELPLGDHTIELTDLPPHCLLFGQNPRVVSVEFGGSQGVEFPIDCTGANGGLRVTTMTGGTSPDPDGYLVNVASETIGFGNEPSFSYDFGPLQPSDYTAILFDVALNCTVTGGEAGDPGLFAATVPVVAGAITEVVFEIDCSSTPAQVCFGLPIVGLGDSTFANADWRTEVAYQTNPDVQWTVEQAGQKTEPGPGTVPEGLPDDGRWVQMDLNNPTAASTGVGAASAHLPATIVGGFTSVRIEFDVWANSARVQAYLKDLENDTYYGIPPGQIISETDGWVRIETGCVLSTQINKMGSPNGTGPDKPEPSHDFEIGYLTQVSGTGVEAERHVVIDNWQVQVWRE